MKTVVLLLLALGAGSLAGCVSDDRTVHPLRPGDPVKRNTFDDLKPKADSGGFDDRKPDAPVGPR